MGHLCSRIAQPCQKASKADFVPHGYQQAGDAELSVKFTLSVITQPRVLGS